jgi:hypothetical protein
MSAEARPSSAWSTDTTLLCERLAQRLRRQGYLHPLAAAVVLAVRGQHGLSTDQFARHLGLPPSAVADAEAGQVAFDALAAPVLAAAVFVPRLDLEHLRARAGGS